MLHEKLEKYNSAFEKIMEELEEPEKPEDPKSSAPSTTDGTPKKNMNLPEYSRFLRPLQSWLTIAIDAQFLWHLEAMTRQGLFQDPEQMEELPVDHI
ncbi:hypothetical protein F4703DRAFT_1929936 [Phycomyces blakesleeanus]